MLTEQQCETEIRCPECNRPMYALKGALNPIFVCSYCGASIDEKTLFEKRGESSNQNNGEKKSLMENLFPEQFMKKYTSFDTFSDFINTFSSSPISECE